MKKSAEQFRHVRLPISAHERLKRLSKVSNLTITACVEVVVGHCESLQLLRMTEEEKSRYLAGEMGFDEAASIYRRSQKIDDTSAGALQAIAA